MVVEKYFDRIYYNGSISVDTECLKQLHKAHLMTIPFEALDVQLNREIHLEIEHIYNKVVLGGRGGYCYELNFLFHTLLSQLGFQSEMLSARIFNGDSIGPDFDHMCLLVKLPEPWLLDVGYGDLFIEPLQIDKKGVQEDQFKDYKIKKLQENQYCLLESLKSNSNFKKRYIFDLQPRKIEDFFDQNDFKQYSPDSYFVKNRICTLPTTNGRKTILNEKFKVRSGNGIDDRLIKDEKAYVDILKSEFKISLNEH